MIDISTLKQQVMDLEIVLDPSLENPPINSEQLALFKTRKHELTAAIAALPIASPEDFATAGNMIDAVNAIVEVIDGRLTPEISKANAVHKSLTGARKEMASDLEDLAKSLKSKRAVYKAEQDRLAREAAEKAAAIARAEALRIQQEQARLAKEAADRIAEEARLAAEAAAETARIEAARVAAEAEAAALLAAEIDDPVEALAAAQAADEAQRAAEAALAEASAKTAEDQAERAREAELALQLAAQAAAAPVVIPRVVVEPVLAKEEGVSWADNWQPEYESEEAVLRALVAAGKIEFLSVNMKAINAAVKSQKSLCNIPGVKAVNNKIERRSSK